MSEHPIDAICDLLHAIMDRGFRSGERYVGAEELAFVLGRPFVFENEDGSESAFDGWRSWLSSYPHHDNDIGMALSALGTALAHERSAGAVPPTVDVLREVAAALDTEIALHPYDADVPTSVIQARDKLAALLEVAG